MTETIDVSALPLVPKNPLPIGQLVKAVRNLDGGQEVIRDAGGPLTRVQFGPKWVFPPLVAVFLARRNSRCVGTQRRLLRAMRHP